MAELPPRLRVRDVELMRALAHPLRTALLSYLMAVGQRTASECATAVDSSASNCSWHLRQLQKWGLVEPAPGTDGRERPWRATQVGLEIGEFEADGATRAAQVAAFGATLGNEQVLTQRYLDTMGEMDPRWRRASQLNQYSLRITPDELTDLHAAIDALVRSYVSTIRGDAPEEARPVQASWRAFLRIEADGRPS
ncbi:helix-turn-helix domain-containing protein [Actinokineospora diospyrosa]|uniref:Helix-turn-helix domain-containing protein n=1 Tax=Actinokineospora diospyrosa TaxID=103728 RepID=A0ABT1IGS0_9PSEU|nr:helix-turn-helix domain-containing protein [Actinokineospora diospyrosa]MCP2271471.1 Helix-turn-helix domain-containing protein [Actinokineospora diospyrosa]